jgi:hypothetical protein
VQPPEWIDAAPIVVEAQVDIAAPPEVVWGILADHVAWPEWFTALDAVEVTRGGSGVGGGRRVTARRMPLDEEFTVWDENAHFAFAVVHSKLPILDAMAESIRIEPIDDGCRVVYRQGLQAKRGFGKVLGLIWQGAAKQLRTALDNLRQRAESRTS